MSMGISREGNIHSNSLCKTFNDVEEWKKKDAWNLFQFNASSKWIFFMQLELWTCFLSILLAQTLFVVEAMCLHF